MIRTTVVVTGMLALLGFSALANAGTATTYSIASFQAKLFRTNSGTFSTSVLTNPPTTVQNHEFGGAEVDGMLLLVSIHGPTGDAPDGLELRVTAISGADTLLDETTPIDSMNSAGNHYVASWVDQDLCDPVRLSARLILGKPGPTVSGEIEFLCAE